MMRQTSSSLCQWNIQVCPSLWTITAILFARYSYGLFNIIFLVVESVSPQRESGVGLNVRFVSFFTSVVLALPNGSMLALLPTYEQETVYCYLWSLEQADSQHVKCDSNVKEKLHFFLVLTRCLRFAIKRSHGWMC
ncbi:hypothetical protein BC830DRAFT_1137700 [Chytriomyces sp. MP71]|nr:hypothetical protein BC830DRAFT_1137700 [Chytriomyces sp. MP71]